MNLKIIIRVSFTCIALFVAMTSEAQDKIREIKIGDIIPNQLVAGFFEDKERSVFIEDLYKEGGLIINFWATWCAPCIKELKVLNTLKPNYPKLSILSVAYEKDGTIKSFIDKQDEVYENLQILTNDKVLREYFPHNSLPHNIWIDKEGVVKAITGNMEINRSNVDLFLDNQDFDFIKKEEEKFDYRKPMSIPDSLLQYRSFFHNYRKEINFNGFTQDNPRRIQKPSMKRFFGWNVSAVQLFWYAYRLGVKPNPYLIELHTRDSLRFYYPEDQDSIQFSKSKYAQQFINEWPVDWKRMDLNWMRARSLWMAEHLYSYELIVPERLPDSIFYEHVIKELEFNLKVKTSIEKQERNCIVVSIDTIENKLESLKTSVPRDFMNIQVKEIDGRYQLIIESATLADILSWLEMNTFSRGFGRDEPYLNKTGVDYRIDTLIDLGYNSDWYNQDFLEERLQEELGMQFNLGVEPYPVLVITDNMGL